MNDTTTDTAPEKRVSDLEDRLDELTEQRDEIASQLERVEEELQEAQTAIAAGGDVEAATDVQSERDALQGTLDRLEREIEETRDGLEAARAAVEERDRLSRLTSAVEEAATARTEYVEALEKARETLREHMDEASDALQREREARQRFTADAGRENEGKVKAARAVLEESGSKEHRKGLSRILGPRLAGRMPDVPRPDSSPLGTSKYATHPADGPELTGALVGAVKEMTPLR